MKYFIGVDTGQVNQGIAVINEKLSVMFLDDTGRDIPESLKGKATEVPDLLKNNYQATILRNVIERFGPENVGMLVAEGPNYSSSANVTQISIGSIHGVNQQIYLDNHLNFAIMTPKSIQYAIHGTAKDITKTMTMNAVKELFPDWQGKGGTRRSRMNSNMGDALAMAYLAYKFYNLLVNGSELTSGEKEVFVSKKKYKGKPKGLIYNLNTKLFLFDKNNGSYYEDMKSLMKT